ncbi:disease resistance protein RGA5-like isoform X2 [Panicum virgatum]|uniref:disease resistance protein RGA5-like isoform X2 n=1 Tax=Panicum virgatum TaxID=38727 RepID=UPI0019D5B4DA|nr:disease resistance protein RGA5-like isoform X2 [Panicum virgatum]
MAAIAVSASTGVMNSLLSKLSILLSDQYKQLKGVRKDIEFLSCELVDMNAALEKLADMEKMDVQTRVWRDKVREMAYDIEDCIDVFMHHLGQGHDKDGLFRKTARKIRKLRVRYQIANKIQELKSRVVEQSQSRDRYKIDEAPATSTVPPVDPRVQAMFEDAKRLVGIDGPRDEITQWLMEEGDTSEQLKVVSIVGFGGLGKTTLANQVYNKIKSEFQCTAFVSVSRSPDMPKILKDMLSEVGYHSMDMADDVSKLITALTEHLADKRYLVVIDDIWSSPAWNIIRCAFMQNNKSSRVITTTRIQEVATACCSGCQGYVYEIQPLNSLDSRSLFFKRLFDTEDGCPKQYREISKDMIKKCRGVPLAITSIASLLESQGMHVEKWEKIRDSLGYELETSSKMEWMRHVLSLSYNDLPHHLKTCLLYLGAYPEDYEIWKNDLVRLWIAEGFVPEKHGLDLEEVAEGYFNELINRCMIQPVVDHIGEILGEVRSCRVHDLMLDLILLKCTEENFITTNGCLHNMKGTSQVRRISHQFHTRNMALAVERMNLSQLRSYMLYPAAKYVPVISKFELLRVLRLESDSYGRKDSECLDLSNSTSHLFLLRYLEVSGFRLKLPKKFGKLQHLMTLRLAINLLDFSNPTLDVTSLSSLRHLTLPYNPICLELRNGVSKLSNLQTLEWFDISMNSVETIKELGELTNLRELDLKASGGTKEEDSETKTLKYDTLAASLRRLGNSNLRQLHAGFSAPEQFWNNCFTCPHHLQWIGFTIIKTSQIPTWMAQANRLAYLDRLQVAQLPSEDVQVLVAEMVPEKSIIIRSNAFPVLKQFIFSYRLSCLMFEPGAMPRLKKLDITYDSRGPGSEHEVSPVAGVEHLASLEEVSVVVKAKHGEGSKLGSLCRESIQRHPRYQSMNVDVEYEDGDDDGLSFSEDDD